MNDDIRQDVDGVSKDQRLLRVEEVTSDIAQVIATPKLAGTTIAPPGERVLNQLLISGAANFGQGYNDNGPGSSTPITDAVLEQATDGEFAP